MTTPATLDQSTVDADLKLNDAGLQTSSFAGTVSASAKVIDFGLDGSAKMKSPKQRFDVIVDVAAIEVDSSNEVCTIELHLSDASNFGTGLHIVPLFRIGDTAVTFESADTPLGRYRLAASNEIGGDTYRYGRLYGRIAGTIGTGFSFAAYMVPRS